MSKKSRENSKARTVGLIVLAVFVVLTLLGMAMRCTADRNDNPSTTPPDYEFTFDNEHLIF